MVAAAGLCPKIVLSVEGPQPQGGTNSILAQSPVAATRAPAGSPMEIVVSAGSTPAAIVTFELPASNCAPSVSPASNWSP